MKLLQEGQLDENVINQYKNLAKINGYVIKDEDGKSQGDLESFINEYLPVLQSQISITSIGQ